jgi:RNA polymerase sigma-70 factor (ECF subfamily)
MPDSAIEYEEIWNHINSLPDYLLVPFKMYISGYKYHEIALHQKVPMGTVKNRIFHARQELKKMLSESSHRG